jgi:hypothetical protein
VRCGSLNETGGTSSLQSLPNEYCYHHKAASAMSVVGIRLWTKTFAPNTETVIRIGLYRAIGGEPRQTFETSGAMLVKSQEGFYSGYFAHPVMIASGEEFWVSQFDTNLTRAAGLDAGTASTGTTYWRDPAGGTGPWAATGIVYNASYHVLCEGNGASGNGVPVLMHSSLPILGQVFGLDLLHAPSRPATLLVGISSPDIELKPFGAPGCRWLSSLDFIIPAGVPVNGTLHLRLPLPNIPAFNGVLFYNQFYLVEPTVNRFGLTTSNGGRGRVGI